LARAPTPAALMQQLITQQATIIAYANDFKLLMILTLATIPFVFLIGSSRVVAPARAGGPAHAFD
jgi:MFS transporter, DHA2 family, multidrug resistance protein